jgi:hypothetical protein
MHNTPLKVFILLVRINNSESFFFFFFKVNIHPFLIIYIYIYRERERERERERVIPEANRRTNKKMRPKDLLPIPNIASNSGFQVYLRPLTHARRCCPFYSVRNLKL